jgi:hypothetical protein
MISGTSRHTNTGDNRMGPDRFFVYVDHLQLESPRGGHAQGSRLLIGGSIEIHVGKEAVAMAVACAPIATPGA